MCRFVDSACQGSTFRANLWMLHKLCERMKHALGKTSVCVCVCVCQGSALTTVLNVSLCPNPTLLALSQRRENKGTSHCLIYLYPRPVLPISTRAFISLGPTLKTIILQSRNVKRRLSLSRLPLLFALSSQRPPVPNQYFISFSRWLGKDRKEWRQRDNTL